MTTAQRNAIDYTTLGWIKPELDETLRQARIEIEAFADQPSDTGRMRDCASYLHQVQGTLRMVELYAPAMVAEEMEQLAQALLEDTVPERDEACATLMRGVVLLPDYLERLQSGHKDIPIVLLPVLNELRAARGAQGLNESVLFAPDLQRALPEALASKSASTLRTPEDSVTPLLAQLRETLASWPDHGKPAAAERLVGTIEGLLNQTHEEAVRRMLWVAASAATAMDDDALPASPALRQAFTSVERETRRMFEDHGFGISGAAAAQEATRQLLYHVAQTTGDHPSLVKLRDTFDLAAQTPSESELAHAKGSISGHNRALLDTVSAALKEDLLRVKDALDLHLRSGLSDVSALEPQVDALGRVADTLGMLGLGVARTVVQHQRDAMQAIVLGQRSADEGTLLDVAGALLYVDASLDEQVARIGSPDADGDETLLGTESRKVLEVLGREAIANFADARQAFVAFVETSWDHDELVEVPRLLQEVAGALQILELPLQADYLIGVRMFTERELIERRRVPNSRQLDILADTMASLEYYLEALREQRPNRDDILHIARNGLESLGYWPLPTSDSAPLPMARHAPARVDRPHVQRSRDIPTTPGRPQQTEHPIAPPVEPLRPQPERLELPPPEQWSLVQESSDSEQEALAIAFRDSSSAPPMPAQEQVAAAAFLEPSPPPPVSAPVGTGTAGSFEVTGDEIDDEIRTIFLEELSEEIQNLGRLLPEWRAVPGDLEKLRPIRRVFHSLKGSGRLVGAKTLGEFAWKTENMLNRVLDNSRPASSAVVTMLDHVCRTLPLLHAGLRSGGGVDADLEGMQEIADRIADGEEAFFRAPTPQAEMAETPAGIIAEATLGPVSEDASAQEGEVQAEQGIPCSVDPVLLEILDAEVRGHLETVTRWLDNARSAPIGADDALLRAIHTMNGAFAMTEVPAITDALTPAEAYIKRLLAAGTFVTPEGITALTQLAQAIQTTVTVLQDESPQMLPHAALAARLAALRDSLPEAALPLGDAILRHVEPTPIDLIQGEELVSVDMAAYGDLADSFTGPGSEIAALDERVQAERAELERSEADRLGAELAQSEPTQIDGLAEFFDADALQAEPASIEPASVEPAAIEHAAAEDIDALRFETEALEAGLLEAERIEAERLEAKRIESEGVDAGYMEAESLDVERLEIESDVAGLDGIEWIDGEPVEISDIELESLETQMMDLPDVAGQAEADEIEPAHAESEHAQFEGLEPPAVEQQPLGIRELLEQLALTGEDPDAPLDLTDLDPELLDIFVEEAVDLLDHSDGLLAQLHNVPGEREPLLGLQRDLHTLKGGARMAGIMAVGELGHVMESLLEGVVEQRIELGDGSVELFQRGIDRLHAMVTRVGSRLAIDMPAALIEEFNMRAQGRAYTAAADEEIAPEAVAKIELKPLSAPIAHGPFETEEGAGVHVPQEQVRIRADLLDRLVNYAGEVAIYRSRLEQQLGAFRGAMGEMEQTNIRLRDQLRRLDSETEAQIIAGYQREAQREAESFDPLELDRFSTLQQLSRGLAESANDLVSLQESMEGLTRQYETLLLQQSRVSSELQEGLMRTRMVPFDALVPRLRRVVRQAATDTGKKVELKLDGAQGELDRNVLERMTAPLEHMLRNAVAHGLETAAVRKKANKPEEGTVYIAVRREGSEVVLEVGDDGAGLDRKAIRKRALERGLIHRDAKLSDSTLDAMIFEPGFSTADEVSQLAGRGVGMDVVASEVRQLGGTLEIETTAGQGTSFSLRLPQMLAVTQAVFVRIGETEFAVPIASVSGVGRINREELDNPEATYNYGGEEYTLHDLGYLLGQPNARAEGQLQMPLLLIRSGDMRAAVSIDQVVGNREIVVKPVGPQVASLPGIFGATVMGDGSVVVILDIAPLVRRRAALPSDVVPVTTIVEARRVPLVMVVDDSVTMRKVTGRVLERHNFEVTTANDGIDALERMAERVPDLMLLDIEMPRMDGYELATAMKADPRLRSVPIIMITSRSGEKHRQRAFEIGVQRYLGKPYQEHDLLRNVFELLAQQQANQSPNVREPFGYD